MSSGPKSSLGVNGAAASSSSRPTSSIVFLPNSPPPPVQNVPNTGFQLPSNNNATTTSENTQAESGRSSPRSSEGRSDGEAPRSPTKNKKKKGQKFFCKGYGSCNLSFTRSEHLARHIRKHTGERPFNCHCGRAFSRLDNLRQHSSTVHADEPIPDDSLAAVSSRYQRHQRTERTRQTARVTNRSKPRSNSGPKPPASGPGFSGHSQPQTPPQPPRPLGATQAPGAFTDPPAKYQSGLQEPWGGVTGPRNYGGVSQVPQTPHNPSSHSVEMHRGHESRHRNRPEPITLPDLTSPSPFENYRNNTPPESPASVLGSRENSFYQGRRASFTQPLASNMTTPTSATFTGANESPIGSPIFPSLNSANSSVINSPASAFPSTPSWGSVTRHPGRRLSVPGSGLHSDRVLPIPLPGPTLRYRTTAAPAPGTAASLRARGGMAMSPEEEEEKIKRRRTWHESGPEASAARELFSPSNTSAYGDRSLLGIGGQGGSQSHTQLPAISSLLNLNDTPPSLRRTPPPRRAPVEPELTQDLSTRMASLGGGLRTISSRTLRGHSRSQSDDFMSGNSRHERRWGIHAADAPGVRWSGDTRDNISQSWNSPGSRRELNGHLPGILSSPRHPEPLRQAFTYPGGGSGAQSGWGRKRCHRDSVGSGEDTSGSEGVVTPSTNEELHPGIVGEGTAEVDEPHISHHKPMPIAMTPGNPTGNTHSDTPIRDSGSFRLDVLVSAAATMVAADIAGAERQQSRP